MGTADVLAAIRRACRPYGVATGDALELTARQIQWACRNGVLRRWHTGVYIDPSVARTPLQDLAAAIAAAGPYSCAWGRSSAAIFGLVPEHPPVPEIVVPRRRRAAIPGAVVHRSSALCAEHMMIRNGIRTTKPLITVVDLGVVLTPMEVAEAIVRARQLHLFEPQAVRATIERLSRSGRTGLRNARAGLELVLIGDRPADSVLELRFHNGPGRLLPPYEYQWEVTIRGRCLRIDFAYPSVKLAIEVDGYEKRKSRESLDYDNQRANLLVLDGWTILRFTWTRVLFDPAGVASEILAILGTSGYSFRR